MESQLKPEVLTLALGPFATNAYIIGSHATGEAIVIDPVDDAERLVAEAAAASWKISRILITHGHLDHVMAAADLVRLTSAPLCIHQASPRLQSGGIDDPVLQQLFPALPVPDRLLTDDDESCGLPGIELRSIFTPGHAPDHVAFYQPESAVLFGGDCLFAGSIGRTDFPNADLNTLMRSITGRLFALPDETRVLPGHMGPTTIGAERRSNPFVLDYLRYHSASDGPAT